MGDIRDDLEAVLSTVDTEISDEVTEPIEAPIEASAPAEPEYDATHTDAPVEDKLATAAPDEAAEQGAEGSEASKPAASKDSMKAPVNWNPKDREEWSKIPRHLQETIINREKEVAAGMANTKAARNTHETFGKLAQSYAPLMAAEGISDPMVAVDGMFRTVSRLRMGSPQDKARVIADMISGYGVSIETLDSLLSGEQPQTGGGSGLPANIEQLLEERLAPVNRLMEGINSAQAQQKVDTQNNAQTAVQDFAKNAEFLADVRNDMADLIDMSEARGQSMPLKEAYDKACAINPQISAIMAQRQGRQALTGSNSAMDAKRLAASSLNGRAAGVGGGGGGLSIRDSISAAWDNSGG